MKHTIALTMLTLLLSGSRVFCQTGQWGKTWGIGNGNLFATTFQNGQVTNTIVDTLITVYLGLGNASICDSIGQLLFCSDGMNLYDRHADLVEDGDTLVPTNWYNLESGFSSYSQSSILLPFGSNQYGLITGAASDAELATWGISSADFDLLLLHRINGAANNGLGKVTRRAIPIIQGKQMSRVQMTATRHGNGQAWWVLKQAKDTNRIYKVLVTKDTAYGPWWQDLLQFRSGNNDFGGQSVFSKDGTKYATTARVANKVFVADFNRCTGLLSNPQVYDVPNPLMHNPNNPSQLDIYSEGLAFSPNGRFLYVTKFYNVVQLDLQDTNANTRWATVAGLDTTWDASLSYSNIYLGPDDKLYIGNWDQRGREMSVFNTPNGKGAASGFCPKCLRFPAWYYNGQVASAIGTPPNITNYSLGATTPPCPLLAVDEETISQPTDHLTLYPNPATDEIFFRSPKSVSAYRLCSITGQVLQSGPLQGKEQTISIDALPPGVYVLRIEYPDGSQQTARVMKR